MAQVQHNTLTGSDLHGAVRYVQAGQPTTGMQAGDLWMDTDDNRLRLYDGDSWEVVKVSADEIVSGTIATARLGSGTANNTTFLRGDQTWGTPAGGAAAGGFPAWVAGRYYSQQFAMYMGFAGSAATANRLYASPILVPAAYTLDRIAIGVGTAAGNCRLGLYQVGTDGLPGALVVDGGAVAIGGTGTIEATISEAVSAGWYFAAALFDATPTVQFQSSMNWDTMGGTTVNTGAVNAGVYRAFTYAALPDPFGTTGLTYVNACPKVALRRS